MAGFSWFSSKEEADNFQDVTRHNTFTQVRSHRPHRQSGRDVYHLSLHILTWRTWFVSNHSHAKKAFPTTKQLPFIFSQWLPLLPAPLLAPLTWLRTNSQDNIHLQRDGEHERSRQSSTWSRRLICNSTSPATMNYIKEMTILEKQIVTMREIAKQLRFDFSWNSAVASDKKRLCSR